MDRVGALVYGLAALLAELEHAPANDMAAALATELCSDPSHTAGTYLLQPSDAWQTMDAKALDAVLTDTSRQERCRASVTAMATVGLSCGGPLAGLSVSPVTPQVLPCRLSTQDLVELLKMPTCYGEVRQVVLKHLGNRYGRRFDTHWDFVRFAQEQHLDLNFTSPPRRPSQP
jgi:hypothetical protein